MSFDQPGLPPRSSRSKKSKGTFPLKKWIQSGLVLFGAVFFSVVVIELYQANTSPTEEASAPVVTAEAPAQASAPSPEAGSTLMPSKPAGAENSQDAAAVPASGQAAAAAGGGVQAGAAPASNGTSGTVAAVPASASPVVHPSASGANKEASSPTSNGKTASPAGQSAKKPVTGNAGTSARAKTSSSGSEKPKAIRHVVQKGETLYMLSRKYYGNNSNVARIAKYNGLSPEAQLTAGTVVFVPLLP